MRDLVYFDLETQRSFGDAGGAQNKEKMGVSVAATFSTKSGQYRVFSEADIDELVEQLVRADLVVGHNHLQFDYPVLQAYTIRDLASQTVNLDMLMDLERRSGRRLGLDSIATASLGVGKSAVGVDALKWWQEHKRSGDVAPLLKIAEYCLYDVKVTMRVHEYGVANGHIKYPDRNGQIREIEVDWTA